MTVVEATESDLKLLAPQVQRSALAASALVLARTLDEGAGLSTAAIARELRSTMAELQDRGKAGGAKDGLDELLARRNAGRAAAG